MSSVALRQLCRMSIEMMIIMIVFNIVGLTPDMIAYAEDKSDIASELSLSKCSVRAFRKILFCSEACFIVFQLAQQLSASKDKKLTRRWDRKRELALRRHRKRTTKYNRKRVCVGMHTYQIQWNNESNGHFGARSRIQRTRTRNSQHSAVEASHVRYCSSSTYFNRTIDKTLLIQCNCEQVRKVNVMLTNLAAGKIFIGL